MFFRCLALQLLSIPCLAILNSNPHVDCTNLEEIAFRSCENYYNRKHLMCISEPLKKQSIFQTSYDEQTHENRMGVKPTFWLSSRHFPLSNSYNFLLKFFSNIINVPSSFSASSLFCQAKIFFPFLYQCGKVFKKE